MRIRVFLSNFPALFQRTFSQQKDQPDFFVRIDWKLFPQSSTVIASFFKAWGTVTRFHRNRIFFGAVRSDKAVPNTIETIRFKIGSKKLITIFFVKEIIFDDPVLISWSGGVQAHLKILVIHRDMMKWEFKIGKDTEMTPTIGLILYIYIPNFQRIIDCDE